LRLTLLFDAIAPREVQQSVLTLFVLAVLAGWLGHRLEKIEGDLENVIN